MDNFSAVTESRRTIYSIASLTGKTVDSLYSCIDIEYSQQKRYKQQGKLQNLREPSNEHHAHEMRIYTDDLFMLGEFVLYIEDLYFKLLGISGKASNAPGQFH